MPKVSIVVPNYNHKRYLSLRMSSIFAQTFDDYELILLDDASTDGSADFIKKFVSHPKVSVVLANECNTGSPFKQWNKGVARARGEYVWIAESDDYAAETFLAELVSILDTHPEVGVAYCQSIAVDENGREVFNLKQWTDDLDSGHWERGYVASGQKECATYLIHKCTIPNASAVLFRKAIYVQIGGADEDFRMAGDWMLWSKMLLAANVAFLSEPLNFFRMHSESVRQRSGATLTSVKESLRVFRFLQDHTDLEPTVRDLALERILDRWIQAVSIKQVGIVEKLGALREISRVDKNWKGRLFARACSAASRWAKCDNVRRR